MLLNILTTVISDTAYVILVKIPQRDKDYLLLELLKNIRENYPQVAKSVCEVSKMPMSILLKYRITPSCLKCVRILFLIKDYVKQAICH